MGTKNAPPPTPAAVARAPACRVRKVMSATGGTDVSGTVQQQASQHAARRQAETL